jgi:hypothetical protein
MPPIIFSSVKGDLPIFSLAEKPIQCVKKVFLYFMKTSLKARFKISTHPQHRVLQIVFT